MRRLARRLFAVCWPLSLALCVAMGGLWAWSYASDDDGVALSWEPAAGDPPAVVGRSSVVSAWGTVWFVREEYRFPPLHDRERAAWSAFLADRLIDAGFHAGEVANPRGIMWGDPRVDRFGFVYCRQGGEMPAAWMDGTLAQQDTFVGVPHWLVFLLFAVLPVRRAAAALPGLRARLKRKPGHCRACGYDLRATPGRCPECGAVPEAAA